MNINLNLNFENKTMTSKENPSTKYSVPLKYNGGQQSQENLG
jgi:hypothetical protein